MRIFSKLIKKYKAASPKQLVMTGVFMLALAGTIGAGLATKQTSEAASVRDCSYNSILNKDNPRCGALNAKELVADLKANREGDLKTIFGDSRIGLPTSKYDRFEKEAKHGVITKSGKLIVDGETVMTDVWTMGRTDLNNKQRTQIKFGNKTYYHSPTQVSFGRDQLDAIVLFDDNGTVEFAVVEACGNPVTKGKKVTSSAKCEQLVSHAVAGKKDTYQFTTKASKTGLAKYTKFKYYVDGKLVDSTSDMNTKTKEIKLTKTSTVKVEVEYTLPGSRNKTRVAKSTLCERKIEVKQEKFEYACKDLYATSKDNKTFRFNVKASHSANVKLISADFTLDGNAVTKGVTQKNDKGEIYTDYTFEGGKTHTVSAVLNFEYTVDGQVKKVQSKETCKEQVTSKKPPVCKHNPNLPPEHPDCKPKKEECKPGIPVGDDRCKDYCKPGIEEGGKECEPTKEVLPETGPAGIAGMFAGITAVGAIGHRLFSNFRSRQ